MWARAGEDLLAAYLVKLVDVQETAFAPLRHGVEHFLQHYLKNPKSKVLLHLTPTRAHTH